MARSASARRQAAALALACLLAAAALALGPGVRSAGAAPAQIDCVVNPNAPECQDQPTTTLAPTTTEPEPVDPSPTTTEPATTTTEPATVAPTTSPPATARPVPTTAAPVETTTTLPATTLTTQANLLVPGDGTQGAESTTTTLRTETRVQSGSGPSDGTLIALIIGGLVVVAALVGALTFRYWRATVPAAAVGERADGAAEDAGATRSAEVTTTRSSPAGARGAPAP
jgi:cobalamin biosynthesis Mg chelatase CobN